MRGRSCRDSNNVSRPRSQRLAYTACPFCDRQFSIRWQPWRTCECVCPSPRFTRGSSGLPYCGRSRYCRSPPRRLILPDNYLRCERYTESVLKFDCVFLRVRCKIIRFCHNLFCVKWEKKGLECILLCNAEWGMREHNMHLGTSITSYAEIEANSLFYVIIGRICWPDLISKFFALIIGRRI